MSMTEAVIIVPGPAIILACREHGCALTWLLHFPGVLILVAIGIILAVMFYWAWKI